MKTACAWALAGLMAAMTGCSPPREIAAAADPDLEKEIQQIKAIDNHAHPVRVTAPGEAAGPRVRCAPGGQYGADVGPREPAAGAPLTADAARDLYSSTDRQLKLRAIKERGDGYPAWVLDKMGVEIMLANRVEMGPSITGGRFRWVPYADALMFPLDTAKLKERNSDRKAFFTLEDKLFKKYLDEAGMSAPPATLGDFLTKVVTPTLERHRQGGAVAEKFEAAYLRSLAFEKVERATAERVYAQRRALPEEEYKPLQDFLFRFIAGECGRLGMAVHLHTGEGAGGYYDIAGGNPMNLEGVLNDPAMRKTNFVMVHGGWPFTREVGALLTKPNAYVDFSGTVAVAGADDARADPAGVAGVRAGKGLFATDAYPFSEEMGWEEAGMVAARTGRKALAIALTGMVRDGEITRARASVLARMVLKENAKRLYGL